MMTDQFELAFAAFLEDKEYDRQQESHQEILFVVARAAFAAGWQAAQNERDGFWEKAAPRE